MANKQPFATLKRTGDFAALKEKGVRIRPCGWMILSFLPSGQGDLRCGWTISRKVGSAVIRNKLKRWCRQFFREAKAPISSGVDINVILLQQPPDFYKQLEQAEFKSALQRGWKTVLKRMPVDTSTPRRILS